jgi:nitrogen fixation NifU-like protein
VGGRGLSPFLGRVPEAIGKDFFCTSCSIVFEYSNKEEAMKTQTIVGNPKNNAFNHTRGQSGYRETVTDHFNSPRNIGEIEQADGIGRMGIPACGDILIFYIRVKDDRIEDTKFKTFACGAATALSSIVSEMAVGKTLDEVMDINATAVVKAFGGTPGSKKAHCLNLGSDALHLAIEDYRAKHAGNEYKRLITVPDACDYPMCHVKDPKQCRALFSRGE